MRTTRLFLALILLGGFFSGCAKKDSDSPFEGAWFAADGSHIVFSGSSWSDSDGDSGSFDYTGDYPLYTLTLVTDNRSFVRRATFTDTRTLELCQLFPDGTLGTCTDLVFDRPTLH